MSNEEKELLRQVVLEILTARHPAALTAAGIRRRVEREVDFKVADPEVEAALELLRGLGLATAEVDALGSTRYWQATSAGVLAMERQAG